MIDSFQGCWQRPGQLRGHEAGPGGDLEASEFAKSNTARRASWSQKGREGTARESQADRRVWQPLGAKATCISRPVGPQWVAGLSHLLPANSVDVGCAVIQLQGPQGRPAGRGLGGFACSLPPGAGLKASEDREGGTLAEGGPRALPGLLRRGVWAAPRTE